jgi:hypothetical protein
VESEELGGERKGCVREREWQLETPRRRNIIPIDTCVREVDTDHCVRHTYPSNPVSFAIHHRKCSIARGFSS